MTMEIQALLMVFSKGSAIEKQSKAEHHQPNP
jgi:hypothetical protein